MHMFYVKKSEGKSLGIKLVREVRQIIEIIRARVIYDYVPR